MSEWFSFTDILAAAQGDLPATERSLRRHIAKAGWRQSTCCQRRPKRAGGDLFHVSLLPAPVQTRLRVAGKSTPKPTETPDEADPTPRERLWQRYEQLPAPQKKVCQQRLGFLLAVETQREAGRSKQAAVAIAAREFGFSAATHRRWTLMVAGLDRADWLAALAPKYRSKIGENICHPQAWAVLKADYLRPEKPTLSSCYRRMKTVATAEGWEPVPSLRTIRRWVERELPRAVKVIAREKRDVAKQLYPAQRRLRGHLHAMQMVNVDGHKFDVAVRDEKGRVFRPILLAIQDLYSGMIVAARIGETENSELVRLAIGDMMERYGIPETLVADNGRAFASKQITGGQKTRYRFKVRDEEPSGLLTSMGVKVIWTQPYSGQSKPIERAFRDLCDTIARHPFCAGAYLGGTPDARPDNCRRAIDFSAFREFVAAEIGTHNLRTDRNTENAKGRSFAEAFRESYEKPETLVAMPTRAQRNLWLLAAEQVRASRGSGVIELLGTRYYTPQLCQWAGKRLTVRFDPQNLALPLKVYSPDDRYLFEAPVFSDVAFDDVDQARAHNRQRRELLRAARTQERILNEMQIDELARLLPAPDAPAEPVRQPKKVQRLATGGAALKQVSEAQSDFEDNFARAIEQLPDDDNILAFRRREAE